LRLFGENQQKLAVFYDSVHGLNKFLHRWLSPEAMKSSPLELVDQFNVIPDSRFIGPEMT
jgi:hypothetical protein